MSVGIDSSLSPSLGIGSSHTGSLISPVISIGEFIFSDLAPTLLVSSLFLLVLVSGSGSAGLLSVGVVSASVVVASGGGIGIFEGLGLGLGGGSSLVVPIVSGVFPVFSDLHSAPIVLGLVVVVSEVRLDVSSLFSVGG